jgi:hypothetical protein
MSVWIFHSGRADSEPLDDHLRALRTAIEPQREALRRIGSDASIELSLGWSKDPRFSGPTIDADTVRLIGDIGGAVVFDLYCE